MLESLRKLYLEGFPIDWQQVDQGLVHQRIPLPTYPFQRKRYWIDASPSPDTCGHRQPTTSSFHPLLGHRLRSALQEVQYEVVYSGDQLPYLSDHRVYGRTVLPTAAGLEAAVALGKAYFGVHNLLLEQLTYHEALVLSEEETRVAQWILLPQGADTAAFRLLSTAIDGRDQWRTHMSGILRKAKILSVSSERTMPLFSGQAIQTGCAHEIPSTRYYAALHELGLAYGPLFQGIQKLWQGDREALSYVRLSPEISSVPYSIHPAFLDGCLHLYPALVKEYGDFSSQPGQRSGQTYLPISLERFQIYQNHITEAWVYAVLRDQPVGPETLVVDIRLYDKESKPVATLDGLSIRALSPEAVYPEVKEPFTNWLYHLGWDEQPLSPEHCPSGIQESARWLIFADRGGIGVSLASLLQERGDQCQLVFPGTTFAHNASGYWTINLSHQEDFRRLVQTILTPEQPFYCGVIYLWGLDMPSMQELTLERLEMAELRGAGGVLFLLQALAEARATETFTPRVWLITRHA